MKKMDKRVSKTMRLIENTFFDLIQENDVYSITIKDICERAQISRSTFYDHYEDYYVFLKSINDQIVQELIACTQQYHFDTDTDDAVNALMSLMKKKHGLFSVLFLDSNQEALNTYISKIKPTVMPVWLKASDLNEEETSLLYDYFMHSSMWLLKKWFCGEINVSEERFKELYASLSKHGIYQYIYTK